MTPRACGPFESAGLELLLIFSALLSAVTGALSGVRAPEARPHHAAASMETVAAAPVRAVQPARTAPVRTAVRAVARPLPAPEGSAFALTFPAALETIRLIE